MTPLVVVVTVRDEARVSTIPAQPGRGEGIAVMRLLSWSFGTRR
ncbi:hypothetical protein AKJ09_03617 [Labilithrix luteola]|uniref:Uncharacterized protein n=1 Tax=Labilithrix luteola TaxID=1391654 RepID=A0A0K1PTT3_9BACT|nr:hypothetical protein AKJ09_03617 [Labilithrix luteola]